MPQFFAPARPVTPGVSGRDRAAGAPARAPFAAVHGAVVAAPELRGLDDALVWMARCLVEHLGFDRAMVLRSGPGRLDLRAAAFSEQPDLAREAQEHAARHPVPLRAESLEVEMIGRRAPALVVPGGDARAWHPITDQLRTRAYVAAPVEAFGRTVATLHADAHFSGRDVDGDDRTLLGVFAQACRAVAERALLVEEVERLRAGVRAGAAELLGLVGDHPAALTPAALTPAALAPAGAPDAAPAHPGLTPRENEVLALMARGATSQEIARRLVLSAGTVKTHARNILRKLGASTRAEAVARALEARGPR